MAYKVKKDPIDKIPKAQFDFLDYCAYFHARLRRILVYSRRLGNGLKCILFYIYSSLGYVSGFRKRQFY